MVIYLINFSGLRTLARLDQLFGEYSGSSESEHETRGCCWGKAKFKKSIPDYGIEVNDDWYSSGSERERNLATSQSQNESATPVYSAEDMSKQPSEEYTQEIYERSASRANEQHLG